MKNILFWIGVFSVTHICSYAVNNLRISDIRSIGMGGNGSTQSILFNPSILALTDSKVIQMNYYNRYLLNELQTVNCNFYYPNSLLPVGFNILSFGYDAYRESMFRLVFAKELSDKISLGIGIQYYFLQTELYNRSTSSLSTDIGLMYSPVDKLSIGMLIMNLPSVNIGKKVSEIKYFTNYLFQIGFKYQIINNVLITGNIESTDEDVINGSFGFEYKAYDTFILRAGLTNKPFHPSFGLGYSFSKFTVDIASIYHPVLGLSSGIGIQFSF